MRDNSEMNNNSSKGGLDVRETGLISALWVTFSSMKTAIVLLLLLAVVSVAGTLIPQGGPPNMYYQMYGPVKGWIINRFWLNNLYNSPAYNTLLALIGLNLLVCSINRFGIAWRRTFGVTVAVKPSKIQGMQQSEEIMVRGDVSSAAERAVTALRASSYQVLREQDGSDMALYASKGSLSIWGPYLTHLSILVIFIGAIVGSIGGFRGFTRIAENDYADSVVVRAKGREYVRELPFRVYLSRFTIPRDKKGHPKGYKSDLRIFQDSKIARQKVIDVNHPLTYKGISFFQSSYGPVLIVRISDSSGNTATASYFVNMEETPVGTRLSVESENGFNLQQVEIDGRSVAVIVRDVMPAHTHTKNAAKPSSIPGGLAATIVLNDQPLTLEGMRNWQELGPVGPSETIKYKDLTVSLETSDYTGLQVTKDPGLPIVYSGFALMLLGIFLSFYISHRIIRLRLSETEDGRVAVLVGASSKLGSSVYEKDLHRLKEALKKKEQR